MLLNWKREFPVNLLLINAGDINYKPRNITYLLHGAESFLRS